VDEVFPLVDELELLDEDDPVVTPLSPPLTTPICGSVAGRGAGAGFTGAWNAGAAGAFDGVGAGLCAWTAGSSTGRISWWIVR